MIKIFSVILLCVFLLLQCTPEQIVSERNFNFVEGQVQFRAGNWQASIDAFSQAIAEDSGISEAYIGLTKATKQQSNLLGIFDQFVNQMTNDDVANMNTDEMIMDDTTSNSKNLINNLLSESVHNTTQFLTALNRIAEVLNHFFRVDSLKITNQVHTFQDISIDNVLIHFLRMLYLPQDLDQDGVIIQQERNLVNELLALLGQQVENFNDELPNLVFSFAVDTTVQPALVDLVRVNAVNNFLDLLSSAADDFALAVTRNGNSASVFIEKVNVLQNELKALQISEVYQFFDGIDNDNDGSIDEECLDGRDNDNDGLTDEDTNDDILTNQNTNCIN